MAFVSAWTFDAFYGRSSEFLDGLQRLGQNYVAEVPADFTGWLEPPQVLLRPTPQELRKRGRTRKFPRLAKKALPASEVRNLVRYSPIFQKQEWQRFHVKEGEKGPLVWEVKHACFYRKLQNGLPSQPHHLMVARNVLDPKEKKYFVANQQPSPDVPLESLLRVGFSRHPIEDCFREGKDELGMDHFEVRGWRAIHRHLFISQLSHLFCSRVQQELQTEKKSEQRIPHGRDGPRCGLSSRRDIRDATIGGKDHSQQVRGQDQLLPQTQL
jgi:SRSO17 transposase